jgi:hypothetical protein
MVKKVVEKTVEAVEVAQGAKTAVDALQATQAAAEASTEQGRGQVRTETREAASKKRKTCFCICGLPDAPLGEREAIGHMLDAECRARCADMGKFPYGEYTCV